MPGNNIQIDLGINKTHYIQHTLVNKMLQLPIHSYEELPDWIYRLEPILFWITVAIGFGVVGILFNHYKKTEVGKPFAFGLVTFSLMFTIARAIENIRKFYIADNRLDIVNGWLGLSDPISGLNLILRIMYYGFSWFSIATFYYESEKYVFQKKTKFIFMISAVLEGAFSIALYFTTGSVQLIFQILATIGFFFCGVAPIIIYLLMAKISSGVLRQSAAIVALGLTFFVVGVMTELPEGSFVSFLVTGQILDAYLIAFVAPICMMLGFLVLLIGFRKMFSSLF
jgi:MFS family permease